MLGLLACRRGEPEGSGTSSCLLSGTHIETGSGREAKSQRAEARGGGIVGREEVEPVLSFLYVSPPPPQLLAACDRKLIGIS